MVVLQNRRARAEYDLLVEYVAGLELLGPEVKSLRNKSGSLHGSYVKILQNQAYLVGAQISPYKFADNRDYDPLRTRRLLLRRSQINALIEATGVKGRTLVPITIELLGNHLKLRFAIARGKKTYERREELKKRAEERDTARELKQKVRF